MSDLTSVLGVISAAYVKGAAIATRDNVMVRGSYLLGCRVSELCREYIESLDELRIQVEAEGLEP